MIYRDTTAIEAVNNGINTPDAFYHKTKLIATSKWIAQGYPGYSETIPEAGYKVIASDWVCGDWDDAIAAEHGETPTEAKLAKLEKTHGTIWVIYQPTSNVFSTGYDVLIKDPEYVKPDDAPTRRRVAHKTHKLEWANGDWEVQYHATKVVKYNAKTGKYTLNSGGWHTMTTAKRMSEYLPRAYRVNRKNWELHVTTPELGQVKLIDGMEV